MDPNNDKVEGTINASVGSVKEVVGQATQNSDLEIEGTVQKTKGRFQKLSGAVKDTIKQGKTLLGIKSKRF
jgi:uncharacterized protein YjbJ (UPF0337 family)